VTLVAKGPSVVRVVVRAVVWAAPLRKLQGRPREQDRDFRLLPLLNNNQNDAIDNPISGHCQTQLLFDPPFRNHIS
jgi:hypothetical protein